ncbi:MerR family transcriptional regulator [Pseudonocardia sp.]|uniref:MerR family transcriptional regulator n=1 Tax=Pseudonocardia sp. TaxID=60912 RepID=UPI002607703B|nr:MerR family transcriptional regulator [Pseudonocardia sp.]
MQARLTIGDFSRITHLSVRTLRRYHSAGLLEPESVDPHTGYRYYSTAQVPTAQVIHRFRELGMPVRDVGEVLATTDPDARGALVAAHLARLEEQLDRTREAVTALRRLLAPSPAPIVTELRREAATTVAAIVATVDLEGVLDFYRDAAAELDAVLRRRRCEPTGPRGGLYGNALFTEERGSATVFVPVADPPVEGRVHPLVLPTAELAVTVHPGPHDDIDVTYGALGSWVAEQAMAVAGPVRERYLVGPSDTAVAGSWRTEIGWPVFRTGGGRAPGS